MHRHGAVGTRASRELAEHLLDPGLGQDRVPMAEHGGLPGGPDPHPHARGYRSPHLPLEVARRRAWGDQHVPGAVDPQATPDPDRDHHLVRPHELVVDHGLHLDPPPPEDHGPARSDVVHPSERPPKDGPSKSRDDAPVGRGHERRIRPTIDRGDLHRHPVGRSRRPRRARLVPPSIHPGHPPPGRTGARGGGGGGGGAPPPPPPRPNRRADRGGAPQAGSRDSATRRRPSRSPAPPPRERYTPPSTHSSSPRAGEYRPSTPRSRTATTSASSGGGSGSPAAWNSRTPPPSSSAPGRRKWNVTPDASTVEAVSRYSGGRCTGSRA